MTSKKTISQKTEIASDKKSPASRRSIPGVPAQPVRPGASTKAKPSRPVKAQSFKAGKDL